MKQVEGRWIFENAYEMEKTGPNRGIALDGWIRPWTMSSDPFNGRSLNAEEQKRILNTGVCIKKLMRKGERSPDSLTKKCTGK